MTVYTLYCLSPTAATPPDGAVLRCDASSICALVGEVASEEYCGPEAEAYMQDLAWLGPRVCRHEAVVEQAMQQGPVLPARFATLFTSMESVQRFVDRHAGAIAGFFEYLGDRHEWAVRGLLREDLASVLEPEEPPASGKEYLLRKRIAGRESEARGERVREACRNAADILAGQVSDFRERRVWNAPGGDGDSRVVLNWAFLLSPGQVAPFQAEIEALNRHYAGDGLSFLLRGPLPPYSFTPVLEASPP